MGPKEPRSAGDGHFRRHEARQRCVTDLIRLLGRPAETRCISEVRLLLRLADLRETKGDFRKDHPLSVTKMSAVVRRTEKRNGLLVRVSVVELRLRHDIPLLMSADFSSAAKRSAAALGRLCRCDQSGRLDAGRRTRVVFDLEPHDACPLVSCLKLRMPRATLAR